MSSRVWTCSKAVTYSFDQKLISKTKPFSVLPPKTQIKINTMIKTWVKKQRRRLVDVMIVEMKTEKKKIGRCDQAVCKDTETEQSISNKDIIIQRSEERFARKTKQRNTYLIAAIMSTLGVSSAAIMAVYYRFYCQMQGGEFPYVEMFGTFSLAVGSAVGMEFWARWAHRALWHASLWHMHESHHRPRDGPFEVNDVFAIVNALPAIALLFYGLFNKGLFPGLCFGAGLGITMFGMAYMFVHDGLVHGRFPVGPIANVPYLQEVAAAHQLHHMEKFYGVPYGLFLGPKEVEAVGGMEELKKEIQRRIKKKKP